MPRFLFSWVHGLRFDNLRGDGYGGLTAAIVALPLALAFGVASGAGPIAGLYGAICVGFLAALFGGTPAQVSGPTGPMTVVMASVFTLLVAKHPEGGIAMAFTAVMLGGVLQILMGVLHLGKYITLMPYAVISGFMSGVGVIIVILQIIPLLGHVGIASVTDAFVGIPHAIQTLDPAATALGLLTLVIVFAAPPRLNRVVPAPLLALVIGTLISVWVFPQSAMPRIGSIPSGLPSLQLPYLTWGNAGDVLMSAAMLAMLGAVDSLLTSLVADNITRSQHQSDRELIGQGIGNLVSGLVGGLPGAGATMRTVINVKSGGQTPLSGMVHAVVLGLIVWKASALTAPIPHAVLAGILIKVGIDIIDWSFWKRVHRLSTKGAGVMYLVLGLTVFVDLITAVVVGVFVANVLTLQHWTDWQFQEMQAIAPTTGSNGLTQTERSLLQRARGRVLMLRLTQPMSLGAAKAIAHRLAIVDNYEILILDLTGISRLRGMSLVAITTLLQEAMAQNRVVCVVGATAWGQPWGQGVPGTHPLPADQYFQDRLTALQWVIDPRPDESLRVYEDAIAAAKR